MSEAKEYPIDCLKWIKPPLNKDTARILIGEFEDLSRQVGYLNVKSNEAEYLEARGRQLKAMEIVIRLITPPAKSPFAEWAGVPVTIENMRGCHLFVLNTSHHIPDTIMFSPNAGGRYKVCISNDAIKVNGKIMYVRDIAHLCEVITALDPAAFEKGGEG